MYDPDTTATYNLAVVAELTGISSHLILRYQEQGLIVPVPNSPPAQPQFDDQALRALRRIDYLRSRCEMNESGLRLLLQLLDEVDRLRNELRQDRRAGV